MNTELLIKEDNLTVSPVPENNSTIQDLQELVASSWKKIAPFWPLKNLIAVNPLQGLEQIPFEDAIVEGAALFQQNDIPEPMEEVNRQTIKWCQAFFDDGQASIAMPMRTQGLYQAWRQLAPFDAQLHQGESEKQQWLQNLSESPEEVILECLNALHVPAEEHSLFLTLMLTTLPGWAGHVKYRTNWDHSSHSNPVNQSDYLAIRLVITTLLWDDAVTLTGWYRHVKKSAQQSLHSLDVIVDAENEYRLPLLDQLSSQSKEMKKKSKAPAAQLVFCIDVRSEPFRHALESQGDYETYGFAGFFGIPVSIQNSVTQESYDSCPVLLKPKHKVKEKVCCSPEMEQKLRRNHQRRNLLKRLYQSVKYSFTTPFALVETLGPWNGIWMALRSLFPVAAESISKFGKQSSLQTLNVSPVLDQISREEQCTYAEGALRTMGLTQHLAPIVVLCGHGSATINNAYASGLDCGACGGNHGAGNARILAEILNKDYVRKHLAEKGIEIPEKTRFMAAEHITTTDEVHLLFDDSNENALIEQIIALKKDLDAARKINTKFRAAEMGYEFTEADSVSHTTKRSVDWAQIRPEWGLSRNASFIAAPREMTHAAALDGRAFLHSYDWEQDPEGASLTTILTAPMVVAQWINSQYLFSTLDNVAYGGGSKVTKNITGKIGVMQGNASDLMNGLPLQSVFSTDQNAYHKPLRLMTVVYAPHELTSKIVLQQEVLQKLVGNGWVTLTCIDPQDNQTYIMKRNLTWQHLSEHNENIRYLLPANHEIKGAVNA